MAVIRCRACTEPDCTGCNLMTLAQMLDSGRLTALMDSKHTIMPAADVEPVKHTKNIAQDYADCDQFVCEKCGIELQRWVSVERDEDDGTETYQEYVFHYCPNCGAKIEGEET